MAVTCWPIISLILIILGGCSVAGPIAIKSGRTDYNVALQRTDDEQLLLNIVRSRYLDRPLFLQNSSLSTSFTFSRSLIGSWSIIPNLPDDYNLDGNLSFSENPTISYQPLQGQEFARRLLGRIPLESLFLLDSSGWSAERVMRVCVQRINGIGNAVTGAGPNPTTPPDYQQFDRLTRLVTELEKDDLILIDHEGDGGPGADLVFHFRQAARTRPEYQAITQMLKLDPSLGQYKLTTRRDNYGGDTISVETRSFAGVLYFLSQSVIVPPTHIADGRVVVTRDENGQRFDWSVVTGDLMRIHASALRPSGPVMAVQYRGHWFYIDDTDVASKSTFALLGQLYTLLAETVKGLDPMLTIPVGG